MTEACARVYARLVEDPTGAAGEADVAAHLGSCLDCFRALTELRDAPRIAALLRRPESAPDVPEPGAAFWEALAARTVDAATVVRRAPDAPPPPRTRRARAMVFAATAAAALVGALGGWRARAPQPSTGHGAETASRAAQERGAGIVDGYDEGSGASDISALEEPELRRLLEGLRRSEPEEISAWYRADRAEDDDGFADQVAGLDAGALQRLARALGGSTL